MVIYAVDNELLWNEIAVEELYIEMYEKERMLKALDYLFLVLAGIYMAFMVYTMSMFSWEVPVSAKVVLLGMMLLVAGVRVLLIGLRNRKVWIGVVLCSVYCGVFYVVDNSSFLFLAACTIGFLELDYNRIIRTYLISVGVALAIVVIAALAGVIDNLIFVKNGHLRYSMGTLYPTDFASLVLFLLLYLWVTLKKVPDTVLLTLPFISFVVSWRIAYSLTSTFCSILFAGIILYHMLDRYVLSKRSRLRLISDWAIVIPAIFFAGISLSILIAYEKGVGGVNRIDEITNRFSLAYQDFKQYGLHPFGSNFELVGYGRNKGEWVTNYNFIDNSYLLSLIRYGYVFLLALVALWVIETRRAVKSDDRRLALVLSLIALHSLSEHHMIEMNYNIALALPLATLGSCGLDSSKTANEG